MQLSPTTLFSREKRKKRIVPSFRVANFEILTAVLDELERDERPGLITFDARNSIPLPLDLTLITVTELIRRKVQPFALQVRINATQAEFHELLRLAIPAVQLKFSEKSSLKEIHTFTKWAVQEAHAAKVELGIFLNRRLALDSLCQFVEETGIDTLTINQTHYSLADQQLSLKGANEIAKILRIPVILDSENISPGIIKRLKFANIEGFVFDSLINHAYTAGVRSALRDRQAYNPDVFENRGQKAVAQTISHYLPII